jgi:hypothetical protein
MDERNRNVDKAAVPSDKVVATTTPTNGLAGTDVGALEGTTFGDKYDEETTPRAEIKEKVLPAMAVMTTPPNGTAGTKDGTALDFQGPTSDSLRPEGPTSEDKLEENTTPPGEIKENVLIAMAVMTSPPDGLAGTKDGTALDFQGPTSDPLHPQGLTSDCNLDKDTTPPPEIDKGIYSRDTDPPPTHLYALGDNKKRKRIYPCHECGEDANGAHQCGDCFKHIHAICGVAYPGSCEGHGQKRLCHDCVHSHVNSTSGPPKLNNSLKAPQSKRFRSDHLALKSNDISKNAIEDETVRSLLPPNMDLQLVSRDEHCMFRALAISAPFAKMSHIQLRAAIVEHVVINWDDTTDMYAEWVRIMHKNETIETYKERMLGPLKCRGHFPELCAAAAILQRHIEIFEYVPGETSLKWEEIVAPGNQTIHGPNLQLVRIGDDHYHVGTPRATAVAEAYRNQTAEMVKMLYNVPNKSLYQGPPPPPLPPRSPHATKINTLPTTAGHFPLGNPPPSINRAEHQEEEVADFDTNKSPEGSDSDGSATSSQQRAKRRITPDEKYQFLGDDVGFVRLKSHKRVIKNKLRNNKQKKWVMSIKRHWNTAKKDACMAAITIRRCDLSKASIVS